MRLVALLKRKRFWVAASVGFFILVYTIKKADLETLLENLQDIGRGWALVAVAAGLVSYLCIAAVLHYLLRGTNHSLPFSTTFRISLLSCTLNYIWAMGGLSGVAAKVYLLAKENISPSSTLSISMVHGFLTNTVAVLFIYLGFFFFYSKNKMNAEQMELAVVLLLFAFVLTWLTIQTMIHESFRKRLWQFLLYIANAVCRKLRRPHWIKQDRAESFFRHFNANMNLLVTNRRILLAPASYALLDWFFMFLCLKYAFYAVHYPVDNWTLLVGFSVGIFANLFSLTPASIGIMEGSMAASFYWMGLDYNHALLATLLYRFAYFFLPILISIFCYKQFFRSSVEEIEVEEVPKKT